MKATRMYLDTSVINFLFAHDAPEKKEITIEFFEHCVRSGVYDVFISQVVIDELARTKDESKRNDLIEVAGQYRLELLNIEADYDEIGRLAGIYAAREIIPPRKLEDALHIAIATVHEMDVLLSWNYRHLANINKEVQIQAVNIVEGYSKPLRMVTPLEVICHE